MGTRFRENPGIQRYPTNPKEWSQWINEVSRWIAEQTELAAIEDTANSALVTANSASESTYYFKYSPSSIFTWNADPSGTFPSSDPIQDIVATLHDPDANIVGTVTVRGQLSTASGTISSVTEISQTGLSATVTAVDAGEPSARAEIAFTLSSGKIIETTLAWVAFDVSTAGGTPGAGGDK